MRIRNYKIDAVTPNSSVKNSVISAINKVKWMNTEFMILKENGSIELTTTMCSLDVKKLFKYFELSSIDGNITRLY